MFGPILKTLVQRLESAFCLVLLLVGVAVCDFIFVLAVRSLLSLKT